MVTKRKKTRFLKLTEINHYQLLEYKITVEYYEPISAISETKKTPHSSTKNTLKTQNIFCFVYLRITTSIDPLMEILQIFFLNSQKRVCTLVCESERVSAPDITFMS